MNRYALGFSTLGGVVAAATIGVAYAFHNDATPPNQRLPLNVGDSFVENAGAMPADPFAREPEVASGEANAPREAYESTGRYQRPSVEADAPPSNYPATREDEADNRTFHAAKHRAQAAQYLERRSETEEPEALAPVEEEEAAAPRDRDPFGRQSATDDTPPSSRGYQRSTPREEPADSPAPEAPKTFDETPQDIVTPLVPITDHAENTPEEPRRLPSTKDEGNGKPGAAHLEGAQAPQLTLEKTAPDEIQIGKTALFTIKVRNTGATPAQGVEIHDIVPKGTRLVGTNPRATESAEGDLVWGIGTLNPGGEATAQLELMPVAEGEIGSVATVRFHAEASVRTIATRPDLTLQVTAPPKVMIDTPVTLKIKISNPGTGAASGIVLSETLPTALKHPGGGELEFEVGTLKPGESRELELQATASEAGMATNVLVATGDASLHVEQRTDMEVVAPGLKVALTGPRKRYLERNATYNISITNPGTAPAMDVELKTTLPKGMKFVSANNSGQYDEAAHAVYWSLAELPPNESGSVSVTAIPMEAGEQKLQIQSRAKQGLTDERNETITIEGLVALKFELVDLNDPVEVGGETTYEIRVTNQGSKAASNVRVAALLPDEMKPVSATGPIKHAIDGQRIVFESLGQLAPKSDATYTIKAKCLRAGDLRVRAQLVSGEQSTPITKEESTRVYSDEE